MAKYLVSKEEILNNDQWLIQAVFDIGVPILGTLIWTPW